MDYGQTAKPEMIDGFDPALKTNAGELMQSEEDENSVDSSNNEAENSAKIAELRKKLGDVATSNNQPSEDESPTLGEVTLATPPAPNPKKEEQDSPKEEAPAVSTQPTAKESNSPIEIAEKLITEIDGPEGPAGFYDKYREVRDSYEGER